VPSQGLTAFSGPPIRSSPATPQILSPGPAALFAGGALALGEVPGLGGRNDDGLAPTAIETWNPGTGAWTERPSLPVSRVGHTASLLASGQVLLLGGADGSAAWPMKAADLHD
jgi:hypothetical protein